MINNGRLVCLSGSESPSGKAHQTVQNLFTNVRYYVVEDDQRLHKSVHEPDWNTILALVSLAKVIENEFQFLSETFARLISGG